MKESNKKNKSLLYTSLILIILWVFSYLCFAFVLAELNPFNWEESFRGGYVYTIIVTLILIVPIYEIIKT